LLRIASLCDLNGRFGGGFIVLCLHDLLLETLRALIFALAMRADASTGTLLAKICDLAMGAHAFGVTLRAIRFALAMGADAFAGTL
jgi:hypothetical protein